MAGGTSNDERIARVARGMASALLLCLTIFTYMLLRLIEARQAHFEREQEQASLDRDVERQENHRRGVVVDVQQEDEMDFQMLEDIFFQTEKQQRPTLGVKRNIRIFTQALATIAFSFHTSATLSIACIGIMTTSAIFFLCLWQRQLNYIWMSNMAAYHLHGTLFLIICATTTAVTMLVWAYRMTSKGAAEVGKEELLAGNALVIRVVGIFSLILYGFLVAAWMYKSLVSYRRRKQQVQSISLLSTPRRQRWTDNRKS